ncbi:hypothetical protein [Mycobacterium sp. ENV421]|uniref:hypothetical protein n=1 Tax=Mycobacterium sp. ENV421 TaxID=1213407 RepID=UPI00115C43E3|nr:hypothetical protein [Mycobacterium sp. ENV421]
MSLGLGVPALKAAGFVHDPLTRPGNSGPLIPQFGVAVTEAANAPQRQLDTPAVGGSIPSAPTSVIAAQSLSGN